MCIRDRSTSKCYGNCASRRPGWNAPRTDRKQKIKKTKRQAPAGRGMSARYKKERKTRGYQECSTRSGRSIPEKGKTRPKILTDIEPAGRSGQLKLVIAQFRLNLGIVSMTEVID